ncbi:hypothetical protein RIF29_19841 [Crotalaria pallida]|uniref:Uncharacterized protein n=1 Tax=Crotalaria pallida TaxID=3830 RepID=A0AAN9IBT2_CROPI
MNGGRERWLVRIGGHDHGVWYESEVVSSGWEFLNENVNPISALDIIRYTRSSLSLPFCFSLSVPFGSSLGDSSLPFGSVVRRSHSVSFYLGLFQFLPRWFVSLQWFPDSTLFGGSTLLPVLLFGSLALSMLCSSRSDLSIGASLVLS